MKVSIRFTKRSEKRSDGTVAIRMRISWNSNRFDMVLPQRVPLKYWDEKRKDANRPGQNLLNSIDTFRF